MPLPLIRTRYPWRLALSGALGCALVVTARSATAQSQPPATERPVGPQKTQVVTRMRVDTVQLEAAARVQRALDQLRDREQAELAEPKSKKVEVQAQIRDKYRTARAELFRSTGMADTTFTRIIQQVSLDEGTRQAFEALLARLGDNR